MDSIMHRHKNRVKDDISGSTGGSKLFCCEKTPVTLITRAAAAFSANLVFKVFLFFWDCYDGHRFLPPQNVLICGTFFIITRE